jgi:flavin reductase (DIM6/NTAB) family NADH-FMN oxidoreductase RutF
MAKREIQVSTDMYPAPVVLVTSADEQGKANIITLAWAANVCSVPPHVAIGLHRSRFSTKLIRAAREFVVNVPNLGLLEACDRCGTTSGKEVDKFALTGLTPIPSSKVKAPLIAECPVNLECEVREVVKVASYTVFIAEVVASHASEEILDSAGRIDYSRLDLVSYVGGNYNPVSGTVAKYGFSRPRKTPTKG